MEDQKLLTIEARVMIAVPKDADPEEVAATFDGGASRALDQFPSGDVTGVAVDLIREGTEDERKSYFEE